MRRRSSRRVVVGERGGRGVREEPVEHAELDLARGELSARVAHEQGAAVGGGARVVGDVDVDPHRSSLVRLGARGLVGDGDERVGDGSEERAARRTAHRERERAGLAVVPARSLDDDEPLDELADVRVERRGPLGRERPHERSHVIDRRVPRLDHDLERDRLAAQREQLDRTVAPRPVFLRRRGVARDLHPVVEHDDLRAVRRERVACDGARQKRDEPRARRASHTNSSRTRGSSASSFGARSSNGVTGALDSVCQ